MERLWLLQSAGEYGNSISSRSVLRLLYNLNCLSDHSPQPLCGGTKKPACGQIVVSELGKDPPDRHGEFEAQRPTHLSRSGLLLVDHLEALFAMGRDPVAKDKVLDLVHLCDRLLIAQYVGSKIIMAFSLTYPHFNRLIRGIVN